MKQRRANLAIVFVVTWIAYASFYLCRKNLSVLMPALEKEAGFPAAALANLVFFYSLAYALGQFLMGAASDRWGARRVVAAGMMVSALANLAMAASAGLESWIALQFVNGVAQATGWSGLVKIMTNWFSRAQRGVVMAWWSSNYVVGAFYATTFATFAATGPLAGRYGWQTGLWLPASLLIASALLFIATVRDEPKRAEFTQGPSRDCAPETQRAADRPRVPWKEVAANPAVQVLASAYFFVKLTRYAFLFWLPLYMVQRLGYSRAEAGYSSSVYELAGFAGVLLAGYASDHLFASRRFPVACLMMMGLGLACMFHPSLAAMGRFGNLAGIALIGMMTFGPDTLIGGAAVQDSARPEQTATAAGFVNGVGSLGQLLSPFVVAQVTARFGWDILFQTLVVCALCGAALLALRWSQPAFAFQEAPVA